MICLDFYGLPGSGKSTISHLLAERLRRRADVVEPSYNMDHTHSAIIRGLLKAYGCMYMCFFSPSCFISIVKIIRDCGHCLYQKTFYLNLLNLAYKIDVINRSKADYLILDQGLWQAVVSLFYRERTEHNYMFIYNQLMELIKPDWHFENIFVNVDIMSAIGRMQNRHACISRVQLLPREERLEELEWQKMFFENIPKHSVVIDSSHNVDGCLNQIMAIIGCD